MKTISLTDLARVTGGSEQLLLPAPSPLSHAGQLANGNGGIVPKLPPHQLSHAEELARGNGGIVPKLPPLSHAGELARGNGGIVPKF